MAPFTVIPIDQLDPTVGQKGVTNLDEFVGPSGQDGAVPTIDASGVITWDETFLKEDDQLDLLKGPGGSDGFIPVLNALGDISFTDQYVAPGDQVTDLVATPADIGKFLTSDGAGNLSFQPVGSSLVFVSTTDATPTILFMFPIPVDTAVTIMVDVAGKRTNGAGRLGYRRRALAYREGAGAATLQGAINTPMSKSGGGDSGSWDVTIDVSGDDLRVIVTGFAANDIEWTARAQTTAAP